MYKSQLIFDNIFDTETGGAGIFGFFGKKEQILSQLELLCYNKHLAIY